MDIRHLRYFVGIAESGSLTAASEVLNVAQPALSVHVANIETELGKTLLVRSHKGVELTPDGEVFYRHARKVIQTYDDMIDTTRAARDRPAGRVSVGLLSTIQPEIIAKLQHRVRTEVPDVTLYFVEASSSTLYEYLRNKRIDFAVLFSLPDDAGLRFSPLAIEEFCLVGAPQMIGSEPTINFVEVFELPLVLPSKSTTWRKVLDDMAERHGLRFNPDVETESYRVMQALMQSGDLVGILPFDAVSGEIHRGTMRSQRLINPEIRGVLALAYLADAPRTAARRVVQNLIVEVFQTLRSQSTATGNPLSATPILRATPSQIQSG